MPPASRVKQKLISWIRGVLRRFDISVLKAENLDRLQRVANAAQELRFLLSVPESEVGMVSRFWNESRSQLKQDLFVLSHLKFKNDGFFVEFGATNGVTLSNSYLLEKKFRWGGILAEPARCWHDRLRESRNVSIDTRCVWRQSGEALTFTEADYAELSTISEFGELDSHADARKASKTYQVETISLLDLLETYNAPAIIDFLSIDTEGSEYEILKDFNFDKFRFRVITCEHNFTEMREKIFTLLQSNGYRRVMEEVSEFDDWYVSD